MSRNYLHLPRPTVRVLLVANAAIASDALCVVACDAEVVVVAPALIDRLHYWTSDDDSARSAAAERLEGCLVALHSRGVAARGYVGDADPLQAMEDALRLFDADEIIVATEPRGRPHWLTKDVVARAQSRFTIPVQPVPAVAAA